MKQYPPRELQSFYFGTSLTFPDRVLFISRPERLTAYKRLLDQVTEFGNIANVIFGHIGGTPVAVVATGIGPSLVGDAVYAVDKPGSTCLYSSTCGGLHSGLSIGDVCLATEAICGDGYSLFFGHDPFTSVEPDRCVLECLKPHLGRTGARCHVGAIFSTASLVRENDPDFWPHVPARCLAIDMECAAFLAAGHRTQKKVGAYFWITDLPHHGKAFTDVLPASDVEKKRLAYESTPARDVAVLAST